MSKSTLASSRWRMSIVPGAPTCFTDPNSDAVASWGFVPFLSRRAAAVCEAVAEHEEGRGLLQTHSPSSIWRPRGQTAASSLLSEGSKDHPTALLRFSETWSRGELLPYTDSKKLLPKGCPASLEQLPLRKDRRTPACADA